MPSHSPDLPEHDELEWNTPMYRLAVSQLDRTAEREVIPAARSFGLAVIPWGPLCGGLLTVLLRLVFLLYAEDRELLPTGNRHYLESLSLGPKTRAEEEQV